MKNVLQAPSFYIAAALTAMICLLPVVAAFSFDYKRIAEIALILATLGVLAGSQSSQQALRQCLSGFKPSSIVVFLVLFALGMMSASLAHEPEQGVIEVITLLSLVLVAQQSAALWQRDLRVVDYLLVALLLSIFALEVKFLTYYATFLWIKNSVQPTDFFFTFDYVRFFNQYQTWLWPITALALLVEHPWTKIPVVKKLLWFVAIVWWLMFFASCGRGVIVTLGAGLVVILLLFGRHSLPFIKITLLTAAIGFLLYLFLFLYLPDDALIQALKTLREGSSGRTDYLWPKALTHIKENPFLGIGPMHFAWFPSILGAHPHNSVLQWGAEWGLPALCLVLLLVFRGLKAWFCRFNKSTLTPEQPNFNLAVISLSFSMLSALIYSLVDGVIVMPLSHLTGALVLSLMFAVYRPNPIAPAENGRLDFKLSIPFALIAVGYLFLIWPHALPRLMDASFTPDVRFDVVGPRFWDVGDISK